MTVHPKKKDQNDNLRCAETQEYERTSAKALGEVSEVTTIARSRTLSCIIPGLSCVQQPAHLISNLHLNNQIELLDKADRSLRAK